MAEPRTIAAADHARIKEWSAQFARTTQAAYTRELANFAEWCASGGIGGLLDVTRDDITHYREMYEELGRAESTIGTKLSTLRSFYRYQAERGSIPVSPAEKVLRPKIADNIASVLPVEAFQRLLAAAEASHARDVATVTLLGMEGLSIAELCAADVRDVISLRGRTGLVIRTGMRPRTIQLSPRTLSAIREHVGRKSGPLLRGAEGGRYGRHAAARALKRLSKAAGIFPPVRPHQLTDSHIVYQIEAGTPLPELLRSLGRTDSRFLVRFVELLGKSESSDSSRLRIWELLSAGLTGDLMAQVDRLLEDPNIDLIAAVAVAGATLEEFLRSMTDAAGISVTGRPSIDSYATALKKAGLLSLHEWKSITWWAHLRNEAAHGHRDSLGRSEAEEMATGIRKFIEDRAAG